MPQNDINNNSTSSDSPRETATTLLVDEATVQANADAPATEASGYSSSRYLDYDTHELLERIAEYEDERRWQRIREGIWISILLHILLFSAFTWIPKYVFHQPQVIDPFDAIKQRKDLTYLDQLPDALKEVQKVQHKAAPVKPSETHVDRKTLNALRDLEKKQPQQTPPQPQQQQATAPTPPPIPQPSTPAVESPVEPSHSAPVPAKPNFAQAFKDPQALIQQALRNSARDAADSGASAAVGGGLNQHPGAAGGAEILSDTQGVDFGPYMQRVIHETYRTWDPLIPEEVNPPILKRGIVEIVFTILPNGRLAPHAMMLTGRSGDVALDRAAWGAIQGADYPPLPREFHGPYLQLRFRFQYNVQ